MIDLPGKKTTLEALRESEERYRTLFNSMLEGFAYCRMLYDEEGGPEDWIYISVNPAFEQITGLKNIAGRKVTEAIPGIKESSPELFAVYGRVARSGAAEQFEIYFSPIGKWLKVSVYSPVKDHFVAVFEDITGRKRAENELTQSLERFRVVSDSIDALVYVVDMQTYEILFLNKYGKDVWGDIVGKVCWQTIQAGMEGPCPFCTNDRLIGDNGEPTGTYVWEFQNTLNGRWYDCRDSAIQWPDGRIVRMEIATDITDRKRMEEALRTSEHRNAKLLEALPDMMFVISREGEYRDFSVAETSDLAVPPDRIIGTNVRDSGFGEKTTDTILHHVNLALETNKLQQFEYELTLPQGTRQYEARLVALSEGEALAIVRDITERKQAEEEIKEREEKFRMIFEQSNDAILFAEVPGPGQLGNIIDVNQVALRKLGYAKEELVSGPTARIVSPRLKQELPSVLSELFASGHITFENELVRKDGSLIPVEVSAQIVTIRDRSFIVGIARDITERKRVENALRSSEHRSAKMLEALPDMMFVISSDGRYHDFSVADPSELAIPPDKIIGTNVRDSGFGEDTTETILHHVNLALKTKNLQRFEYELAFPGGKREYEARVVALSDDEALGIVRDITDRRRVEEALHQANKKLNMLSSITRHDILNLIMAIRGYLEFSLDLVRDPELRKYMEKENEAVNAIQRQIEFTRYYQDIGVEEPKWQDVGELVARVAKQLDLTGIGLENLLSGLEVFADPLIEKVFYNLIENSIRHGEHVTAIRFSSSETDSGMVISYRDNGIGISEENRKKLFQRGFGTHTGLGLFLSREILSISDISLRENGESGKGVNFEILVPEGHYRTSR
jgi:PAS domain S-box-containing protein